MLEYIDIYCERLAPGLWGEPLNLISNLAFFIAAFLAFLLARRKGAETDRSVLILIVLLCAIGAGSSAFHSFANRLTALMDVLAIAIYILVYLWFYCARILKWKGWVAALVSGSYLICSLAMGPVQEALSDTLVGQIMGGTLSYVPALFYTIGFGLYHRSRQFVFAHGLLLASAVFILSMTLRSLDLHVCGDLPIGTHYFWHIFNGIVLYLTLRTYILNVHSR
ncbi:ceramidase domain-containing protein [Kiloniella sp. b19]|uniref:ceramidase domain-containing protein n=1 Tax=Kiloniella sp. GXU_MW_B19 TaxID=3141326 RepID=UPI0031D36DB1